MPQKLHHQKKAYYSVQTSSSRILLFPQTKARNDKTFAADDKRHGAFNISANFAPKKAKKISDKSAEPGELQRRGKEGRKRSSGVRLEQKQLPRLLRGLLPVHTPSSCDADSAQCPPSPRLAPATKEAASRFPDLTASRSGPRTGSRSPNLACLSIRTWGQIRISQTFRPFDQDLAPDSDFPNLPASRSGPWGWIQVPKHSGLSIMTSGWIQIPKPSDQDLWPDGRSRSRFPNLLVSRSGPQVGSWMPNLPTSLHQNLKTDRGAKSRFPNILTSRSGPHSLSSNKRVQRIVFERNLSKSPYFEEKKGLKVVIFRPYLPGGRQNEIFSYFSVLPLARFGSYVPIVDNC